MSSSRTLPQHRTADSSACSLFKPTLAALLVLTALQPVFAAETSENTLTVEAKADDGAASPTADTDYSVPVTTAGTKMPLALRDIPQSATIVSKQRMQDQALQSVGDVLTNTTGISAFNIDSNRSSYWSRGYLINNYLFDGIPTVVDDIWDFGDNASDTAIYDRIEVIRGANSLSTGSGYPSASVNMVRKHADSKELTGSLSAETGSWDKQRYVGDVTVPLNEEGTVRARAIGGYQENDSWLDRYHNRKRFLSTIVDADLTDSTTLSLGWDFQQTETRDPSWGGLPTWYSNGERTHYDRSFNAAPDWSYTDKQSNKVYANLTQRFDNGWQAQINGSHSKTTFDSKLMYPYGYPDQQTGQGAYLFSGWNKGTRKVDSVDVYANGPFELLGRSHELMLGGSYSRQKNYFMNTFFDGMTYNGDYNNWDGNTPQGDWNDWTVEDDDTIRQKSAYTAARFSLADPLSLLVGARYTQWSARGTSGDKDSNKIAPYAGLTYDINDTYSAYASYTTIFQPQSSRDASASYLDPVTGKSYEAGLKGDWANSRLTATLSVFRTEQNNLGVNTYGFITGTTEYAYQAVDSVSRGVEFEVNGALTDNWQMTFGASRYIAEQRDGTAVKPELPRTTAKLFTSYRLPMLQDLTVGGGVNWQNHTWQDNVAGPLGSTQVEQSSYTLVNLFSRYQVTKQLSVQANINNLFDKEYYDYLGTYAVYGAPRNFSVSANYNF
ncbi:ferric-rhodotorulic acid/ferric-coprogen receptor FhuE [Erwinia sp. JUb26]|uniref:ferric-rhodotorulic acid/ferric-coprogen receptor FhuE n=1 Tax=Erwinia sp. JUb26 TaxID=2485126 RepID=UPI000F488024|nr:ferric-rhodotorulic acid/ferric-coprogen receptor FhuE [Erwinia sp. JUb26]ROR08688.1 outer membrane receptor for ferric coprogen and ferric-rhodotorulic acid [Erwinia sp. JUb26]